MDPHDAIEAGADDAICGDCPQRRNKGGMCYVVPEQAPLAVYRAWKRGRYLDWRERFPDNALQGRSIRFGSYGDPAAVPFNVWRRLRSQKLKGWTGYTHQWRSFPHLRPFLMASVDTEAERAEASADGWRTFRVRDETMPNLANEVDCPTEVTTCENCGLCRGSARIAKSVTIVVHGYLLGRKGRKALPVAV
jgi:hypothetical protein